MKKKNICFCKILTKHFNFSDKNLLRQTSLAVADLSSALGLSHLSGKSSKLIEMRQIGEIIGHLVSQIHLPGNLVSQIPDTTLHPPTIPGTPPDITSSDYTIYIFTDFHDFTNLNFDMYFCTSFLVCSVLPGQKRKLPQDCSFKAE